jgi:flagellar basal body-associated protein FliL
MLGAMVTLILIIVGVVLIIFILGYGIYITFYPLSKTVKGGIDAMKERAGEKEAVTAKRKVQTSTAQARRARSGVQGGTQKRGHKPHK